MKYIILIVILIIIVFAIIKSKSSSETPSDTMSERINPQYLRYYNSINQMSYQELDKIHNDLLPLCIRSLSSGLVWYDDSIENDKKAEAEKRINDKIGELIPEHERIYGCTTYEDARRLNQAIVKRLDEME